YLADLYPAHHHLRARVHLASNAARVQRHHGDGGEFLLVQRYRQPGEQRQGDKERDAGHPAARLVLSRRVRHPATRTVVVAPQMARLMKKSMMLIMTIAVRTALPTATPTPAGPPLAR